MIASVIYDSGMLIGLVKGSSVATATHEEISRVARPIVPGPVLAQVWRDGAHLQAKLSRYLRSCSVRTEYAEADYRNIGVMLGRATSPGKRTPDVIDAVVAYTAARHQPAAVVTSDSTDIIACLSTIPRARVLVVPV